MAGPNNRHDSLRVQLKKRLNALVKVLFPDKNIEVKDDQIRVGNNGSLVIFASGAWYSHETEAKGDILSLIGFALGIEDRASVRQWALDFLAGNPPTGGPGTSINDRRKRGPKSKTTFNRLLELARPMDKQSPAYDYLARTRGLAKALENTETTEMANAVRYVGGMGAHDLDTLVAVATDDRARALAIQHLPIRNDGEAALDSQGRKKRRTAVGDPDWNTSALCRLPACQNRGEKQPLVVVEGIEDMLAVRAAGYLGPIASCWSKGRIGKVVPKGIQEVIIVADRDTSKDELCGMAERFRSAGIDLVRAVVCSDKKDAADMFTNAGAAKLLGMIESAAETSASDAGEVRASAVRIARAEVELFDHTAELEKERLRRIGVGITLRDLKKQARAAIPATAVERNEDDGAEGEVCLEELEREGITAVEPWHTPVDLLVVLDRLRAEFELLIDAEPHVIDLLVAYAAATHWHSQCTEFPLLGILAAGYGSGKSAALGVMKLSSRRGVVVSDASAASVFRAVDKYSPCLCLDEGYQLAGDQDDGDDDQCMLRKMLKACHQRETAWVSRAVPDGEGGYTPHTFNVWAPISFSLNGILGPQIMSRSVVANMRRSIRQTHSKSLDRAAVAAMLKDGSMPRPVKVADRREKLLRTNAQLQRAASDQPINTHSDDAEADLLVTLGTIGVDEPRRHDVWRPLFRVAYLAGGEWPTRVRRACQRTEKGEDPDAIRILAQAFFQQVEAGKIDLDEPRIPANDIGKLLANSYKERGDGVSGSEAARRARSVVKAGGVYATPTRIKRKSIRAYHTEKLRQLLEAYRPTSEISAADQDVAALDAREADAGGTAGLHGGQSQQDGTSVARAIPSGDPEGDLRVAGVADADGNTEPATEATRNPAEESILEIARAETPTKGDTVAQRDQLPFAADNGEVEHAGPSPETGTSADHAASADGQWQVRGTRPGSVSVEVPKLDAEPASQGRSHMPWDTNSGTSR